jgi:hypothetical protein
MGRAHKLSLEKSLLGYIIIFAVAQLIKWRKKQMISSINKTAFFSNKITATAIALLLLLSMITAIGLLSPASALAPNSPVVTQWHSFVYCSVGSNVVGKGQQILLVTWTADIPPDVGETDGLIPSVFNRASWSGMSFNVTDPDGITTNIPLGPSDSVGGGYAAYTPTKVGTYTVVALFPDTWKNSTIITLSDGTRTLGPNEAGYNANPNLAAAQNQHYTAAASNPATFICQEDPVPSWTESPLPNDYWTRPINAASRLWSQLGGNWLAGAWQQPAGEAGGTTTRFLYGKGTETSHIMWTRPLYLGGYMEARFGDTGYQTGHYQGLDFSAIILNGRIYYPARADAYTSQGFNVVDLYTGELMMYINDTMPAMGQIYNYASPNQHGGYSYLYRTSGFTLPPGYTSASEVVAAGGGFFFFTPSSTWEMLDGYALPLRHIAYIANVTAVGTNVIGNNGEILYYNIVNKGTTNNPSYRLTCWNSTNIAGMTATPPGTGTSYWQWRPEGGGFGGTSPPLSNAYVYDGRTAWSLNVSIPNINGPRNSILNQTGTIQTVRVGTDNAPSTGFSDNVGGYVIVATAGQNNEQGVVPGQLWALSLDRGQEGTQLWTTSFTPPFTSLAENETLGGFGGQFSMIGVYPEDGVMVFHSTKKLTYYGYDMKTGTQLWTSPPEPDNNYYSTQYNYYKGMLLTSGYGGVVIAYNITTGQQAWNFTALNVGFESPYGNYPINIFAICDGKIYTLTGEHSVTQPMWRGPNIRCINAADGTEIWNLLGFGADGGAHLTGQYMQMGDGKVVGLNYFDNQIYCIGAGPSATTVSAPQVVPALGSSVMITGTVTDQTPTGRRNDNNGFDFTLKGTPAISDASMGRWMEYMFENQIKPSNATGVPVTLTAIDPNGNLVTIGDVTTDITGTYGIKFKPEVPGTYQIIATFAGSKAYSPSFAQTYLAVDDAAATPTPGATPVSESAIVSAIMMYTLVAAIAIIIVIIIVAILILRKRP